MSTPSIPQGFRMGGLYCGVKRDASRLDLSLFVSDRPATAAGVFTQNLVCAAPVTYDRSHTPATDIRAVVVNSGNANACTGQRGLADAAEMARLAAKAAGGGQALVMSTGIIGEFLPLAKIAAGIERLAGQLGNDEPSLLDAAWGITTTDTVRKIAGRQVACGGTTVQITGVAKGAAMIGPNMATMLALVMTDAALAPATAQRLIREAADSSFNCVSVEGHTSTNDSLLLVANGAAGGTPLEGETLAPFAAALNELCIELARAIPADGEGATHLVTIDVSGCRDRSAAMTLAKAVANSALVKTAIAGSDPNWGRIVSAAGYAGVPFDPRRVWLRINGLPLYKDGAPLAFDAATVSESIAKNRECLVELGFGEGAAGVRFWTTDLTAEYVRLNADYHT